MPLSRGFFGGLISIEEVHSVLAAAGMLSDTDSRDNIFEMSY